MAPNEPSYYKTVNMKGGKTVHWKSNPDIPIVRTHDTVAQIRTKDWEDVSQHRPVTFAINANVKLKEMRSLVAK